jgi:hypothetical protein
MDERWGKKTKQLAGMLGWLAWLAASAVWLGCGPAVMEPAISNLRPAERAPASSPI